jgi:hypothetical protein
VRRTVSANDAKPAMARDSVAVIGVATQKRHDGRNEKNHVIFFEAPTPLRFRPSSDPAGSSPTVPPDVIRAAATADAVSATRDPPPVAPAPSNCRDGAGLERLVFRAGGSLLGEKKGERGETRYHFRVRFGPSIVSSITNTRARHGPPRRCAFPARPHSLARRAVPPLPSRHLTYILAKSATAWSSASAPATSTVCFAFIAACITAWCALSAST